MHAARVFVFFCMPCTFSLAHASLSFIHPRCSSIRVVCFKRIQPHALTCTYMNSHAPGPSCSPAPHPLHSCFVTSTRAPLNTAQHSTAQTLQPAVQAFIAPCFSWHAFFELLSSRTFNLQPLLHAQFAGCPARPSRRPRQPRDHNSPADRIGSAPGALLTV